LEVHSGTVELIRFVASSTPIKVNARNIRAEEELQEKQAGLSWVIAAKTGVATDGQICRVIADRAV
jgi:hypothetical protein